MFAPTRYLDWARRFYGKVELDLASSGAPPATFGDVGLAYPPLEDASAYERLRPSLALYNDLPEAEVCPALGASQAFFLAYAAMLSPGDEILLEHPVYEPLVRAAEGLGAGVRSFTRRADEGYAVVPERVAASITPRTRAVVVTNLHNPTGVRTNDATLRELALVAEARGAYLLVNEVYAPFDDLPEDGVFRASARKLAPNVVTVGSLTKCYGLGAHRVGWLTGPAEIIERANTASVATFGHLPLAYASLSATLLANVGAFARRAKGSFDGKRELAARWAARLPNASWSAPSSGLFGFVTLDAPRDRDLLADIERFATEKGVLVGPGTFFGAPNGFRLSWASLPRDRFEDGLERLTPLVLG